MENNDVKLDELVGTVIDGDMLKSLITSGRISFNLKDVNRPSAVSEGASNANNDGQANKQTSKEQELLNMIASVKENEALVKTLEDMRDDMLRDMDIKPVSKEIADAAKALGSTNGNITKDVFDTAETILDPDYIFMKTNGFNPKLAAITGNGNVTIPKSDCSEVSRAIYDTIKIDSANFDPNEDSNVDYDVADNIAQTNQKFADQMNKMFKALLNELFWNYIWTRMWVSIFDLVEKLLAKPIDMPILLFKSLFTRAPHYKLSTDNYYKYGVIHKLLNKLKIIFLCRIPTAAWPEYAPEVNIKIYYNQIIQPLVNICSNVIDEECANEVTQEWEDMDDDKTINADAEPFKAFGNIVGDKINQAFDSNCPDTILDKLLDDLDKGDSPHKCIEAAKKVIDAVYHDALYRNKGKNKKKD